MKDGFSLKARFGVPPRVVYEAWMSSEGHTAMTGSAARIDARVGGTFEAWDGYIAGTTLELEPAKRIVQTWRTSEFPKSAADSRLEIVLEATGGGTKLTLTHSNIPEDQVDSYREGWDESYFQPMEAFFSRAAK